LLRLWTQENLRRSGIIAAWCARCGNARKLPAIWRALPPEWLTVKLREDLQAIVSADQEFAMSCSRKQRTQRALAQPRILKTMRQFSRWSSWYCSGAAFYLVQMRRRLLGPFTAQGRLASNADSSAW